MADVGGGRGHGQPVGDPRLKRGSGQHHEAARVTRAADHSRSRHRRVQRDRRLRRGTAAMGRSRSSPRSARRRARRSEPSGRLKRADHRRGSGGDRPVMVDRVHHSARIADAAGEGERVGRARRKDRPGVEQGEPGVAGEPDDPARSEPTGAECGVEIARRDRPIHREPPLDGRRDHRAVEHDGHRRCRSRRPRRPHRGREPAG